MAKKFPTLPLVTILWHDHHSHDETWLTGEEAIMEMAEPVTVQSVGWLYRETKTSYVLVATYQEETDTCGQMMSILKSAVVRKIEIKAPRKPKESPASTLPTSPTKLS